MLHPDRLHAASHNPHFLLDGISGCMAESRVFDSGSTRDTDTCKLDYEGFLSPLVLEAFAKYMHKNRHMADGSVRDSDNWQLGIPFDAYMKSGFRHFMEWWAAHRNDVPVEQKIEALCALLFNVQGYLHEILRQARVRENCD